MREESTNAAGQFWASHWLPLQLDNRSLAWLWVCRPTYFSMSSLTWTGTSCPEAVLVPCILFRLFGSSELTKSTVMEASLFFDCLAIIHNSHSSAAVKERRLRPGLSALPWGVALLRIMVGDVKGGYLRSDRRLHEHGEVERQKFIHFWGIMFCQEVLEQKEMDRPIYCTLF